MDQATLREEDRRSLLRWLALAVTSLVLAGLLSLLVVVGRMPPFDRWVTDPLFFKRCLVVHVDLALVVWFFAFLAGLFHLIPGRRPANFISRESSRLAAAGVALMVAGAASQARPILSNYIPLIDSALFATGLAAFGAALVMAFLDARLLPRNEGTDGVVDIPPAARAGLRAAAVAVLIAALTLATTLRVTPPGLLPETRAELVFWGPGHVLQFASALGMMSAWILLVGEALGSDPIGRRAASLLFGAMLLPLLGAPLLAAHGTTSVTYQVGFTRLMELGIFPVVLVVLGVLATAVARAPAERRRDRRIVAVGASAALTLLGFVLGALVDGSNTIVPAHYHASIGAVTVSYMAVAYRLLGAAGAPIRSLTLARLSGWQPVLFGVGQSIFASGFALAGAHGMARKAFGAEQHARTAAETAGLVVMGIGGLVAVAGGVLFLVITTTALRAGLAHRRERTTWQSTSIRSRG